MSKTVRTIILVLIVAAFFGLFIFSSTRPVDISGKVWNENMVLGDVENATRHYIVYTDLMCPYCNYYARTIQANDEEFQKYISENKIAYEVRVTDMLYESSGIEYSLPSAEAAYCAAKENRFWDYYHKALDHIFTDYYEKGIGYSKTAPMIEDMARDYWENIAKEAGLSEDFSKCFNNRETLGTVQETTYRASKFANGLPYFYFGKFSTGGFDPSWEWTEVKQMLDEGLK